MGRRRRWTPEQKAAIIEESFASKSSVCAVGRRRGIASSQLFGWRREARAPSEEAGFAPAVLIGGDAGDGGRSGRVGRRHGASGRWPCVVIGEWASPAQVGAVLKAVRR